MKLGNIQHFVFDLDGTLYRGGTLLPGVLSLLETLKSRKLCRSFVTNNCSHSVREYVARLGSLGIDARPEEIATSNHATLAYLRAEHSGARSLYVLGTPAQQQELAEAGYEIVDDSANAPDDEPCDEPDAVVVGFDTGLTYQRLCRAAWHIAQGKPFIATHPDLVCPTDEPTLLVDCGSICAALEAATGKKPMAIPGKPGPWLLESVANRHGLALDDLAVVGDRLYTDMAMARAARAMSVLVLSGETTAAQAQSAVPPPDLVVRDLVELNELLLALPLPSASSR